MTEQEAKFVVCADQIRAIKKQLHKCDQSRISSLQELLRTKQEEFDKMLDELYPDAESVFHSPPSEIKFPASTLKIHV